MFLHHRKISIFWAYTSAKIWNSINIIKAVPILHVAYKKGKIYFIRRKSKFVAYKTICQKLTSQ